MYAIIQTGGKQYRVVEGQTLRVEKLDLETGADIDFGQALLICAGDDIKIGGPFVEGSQVSGEVIEHGRHKKVKIMKFKRRKHHMKTMGHRQWFTEVRITGIK